MVVALIVEHGFRLHGDTASHWRFLSVLLDYSYLTLQAALGSSILAAGFSLRLSFIILQPSELAEMSGLFLSR